MEKMLRVKAGKNGPVHMPGLGVRQLDASGKDIHVISDQVVEVPDTRFYRRRIEKGDLVVVTDTQRKKSEE